MSAHTPGPWRIGGIHRHKGSIGPDCKQSIHGADGSTVAVVFRAQVRTLIGTEYVDTPTDSPNAALVAAAPDLLAALKELVDAHAEMTVAVSDGSQVPFVPVLKRHVAAWEAARDLIKKVEGE